MTDPSTPVPSDEAVNAAILAAANPVHDDGHTDTYYAGLLTAAYAIDAPRLRAEAAAEARADYDDFIEGLTAKLNAAGVPAMPSWPDAIDWLIERAQSAQAEARAATLREVESDEALNVATAAFENAIGTTIGVGDGMRAALGALLAHFNPEANDV